MMLKTILITPLFLLGTCNLHAQQQKFARSTFIGISGGGSLCRVSFNPVISQNMLTATSAGLVFRHVSEPHIGIQVELNYAGRGWIENRDSIGLYKRNLQVLDIPVTAAFILGSKKLRFVFTLGPYVTYLLHDKETISIPDTQYYQAYYLKKMPSNWEFGFTGGLSIEFHSGIGVFGIRAAYCHSLTNIFSLKDEKYYYSGSRTQTIQAGLTYFIEL